ncbi:hypothetical protein T492DRAFT_633944 [Pavlovales sp. CCMP2436]|nr:hypothetical protein T492DRAFT_633944 [Pavlovales sp. CCMP2436]
MPPPPPVFATPALPESGQQMQPPQTEPVDDPGGHLMRKMGWAQGQGLGKSGQGMTTPLVAVRTGKSATIINAQPQMLPPAMLPPPASPVALGPPPAPAASAAAAGPAPLTFRGRPSKVLLLRNMSAASEVDDSLVADVGTECSAKYGEVVDVQVRVMPPGEDGAEDVRVYVRFAKQSSAMRAYLDLDGRFFNERQLAVWFFEEDAFEAGHPGVLA